jgi:hypothetical protein
VLKLLELQRATVNANLIQRFLPFDSCQVL